VITLKYFLLIPNELFSDYLASHSGVISCKLTPYSIGNSARQNLQGIFNTVNFNSLNEVTA
jgi:hypothetical protein